MKELRSCEIRATVPAGAEKESPLIIEGTPIIYEAETTITTPAGEYKEIIRRGALDNADLSDVRLLYNHDMNKIPLARTPKTMQLTRDLAGLQITATLPATEAGREAHEAIKRGDLTGMSFAFKVPPGGDKYDPETNTRTINRIAKVYETSIVPFPAYAETSVEARTAIQGGRNERRNQAVIACNRILMKEVIIDEI